MVAAFGHALGSVFGMAGTFVAQPNLQALLWAIDGARPRDGGRAARPEILQDGT